MSIICKMDESQIHFFQSWIEFLRYAKTYSFSIDFDYKINSIVYIFITLHCEVCEVKCVIVLFGFKQILQYNTDPGYIVEGGANS